MTLAPLFRAQIHLDRLAGQQPGFSLLGHVSNLSSRAKPREAQAALAQEEYAKRGDACLADLEGSFALVVQEERRVKVAADRVSSRKIYYYWDRAANTVYLSEKLSGLFSLGVPKEFDPISLFEFCAFSYVLGNRTLFRNVYEVRPAHILRIEAEGVEESPYWTPLVQGYVWNDASEEEVMAAFHDAWSKEIARLAAYSDQFIIPLSGGLDSRLILGSLLQRVPPSQILTYTFGPPRSYDFLLGKQTSAALGCENVSATPALDDIPGQIQHVLAEWEGQAESFPYAPYKFSRSLGRDSGHVLSGYIGDVLAGSRTPKRHLARRAASANEISRAVHQDLQRDFQQDLQPQDTALLARLLGLSPAAIQPEALHQPRMATDYLTDNIEQHFYDNRGPKLISYILFPENECFDYHLPFISRGVFELALRIPAKYKAGARFLHRYIRKYHAPLAAIPTKAFWGRPLNAGLLTTLLGMVARKGRNALNRQARRWLNRPLLFDPHLNYADYAELYRRDERFRVFVKQRITRLKERHFVDRMIVERILGDLDRMAIHATSLISRLAQLDAIAERHGVE